MHLNNFNFLRFLAAILVIFGHSYPLAGYGNLDYIQELTAGLFPTAHIGVCMFFSISGYLIAKSLISSKSYINFLWKRFIRIMPGLIVAVLFTIFVIGPLATTLSLSQYFTSRETFSYLKVIKIFPSYNDSLPGVFKTLPTSPIVNGSLWTLAYEVTCYALLLAGQIIFRKYLKFAALGIFLVIWLSFFYWHDILAESSTSIRFIHLNWGALLDFGLYFIVGSLLYFYRDFISYHWGWLIAAFVIFMMSYILSSKLGITSLSSIVWIRYIVLPYATLSIGFTKGPLNYFGKFGDISYGLYIYAFPIQQLVLFWYGPKKITIPEMFLYSLVLVLPIAWLSWKYVEEPVLKRKNEVG
ncbi:MAG: acyltransferase [Dyadobacter sp.]